MPQLTSIFHGIFTEKNEDLQSMYADVQFVCNGKTLLAHRLILSTYSEYFRNLFKDKCEKQTLEIVDCNDMDFATLECLIKFLYGADLELTDKNCKHVIAISEKFKLISIFKYALSYLMDMSTASDNRSVLLPSDQLPLLVRHFSIASEDAKIFHLAPACIQAFLDSTDLLTVLGAIETLNFLHTWHTTWLSMLPSSDSSSSKAPRKPSKYKLPVARCREEQLAITGVIMNKMFNFESLNCSFLVKIKDFVKELHLKAEQAIQQNEQQARYNALREEVARLRSEMMTHRVMLSNNKKQHQKRVQKDVDDDDDDDDDIDEGQEENEVEGKADQLQDATTKTNSIATTDLKKENTTATTTNSSSDEKGHLNKVFSASTSSMTESFIKATIRDTEWRIIEKLSSLLVLVDEDRLTTAILKSTRSSKNDAAVLVEADDAEFSGFVLGGESDTANWCNQVVCFNTRGTHGALGSDEFVEFLCYKSGEGGAQQQQLARLLTPVRFAAAAAFSSSGGGGGGGAIGGGQQGRSQQVYVTGGYGEDGRKRVVQVYDVERDAWHRAPEMQFLRCSHGMAAISYQHLVYVVGGDGGWHVDGVDVGRTAEVYDTRTSAWRRLPDLEEAHGYGTAACSLGDRLFVVGGCGTAGVQCFDAVANKWRPVASMNRARSFHAVSVFRNELWVIGSSEDDKGSCERFSTVTETWSDAVNLPTAWSSGAAFATENHIICIGGGYETSEDKKWIWNEDSLVLDVDENLWTRVPLPSPFKLKFFASAQL